MTISIVDSDVFTFSNGNGGAAVSFGSSPTLDDFDVLFINSVTVVATPVGFSVSQSNVGNQGCYAFTRKASGGESTGVTITTTGNHNTEVIWARVRGADAIDEAVKAAVDSALTNTTPTVTTGTMDETGELALAFMALLNLPSGVPAGLSWSNGFTTVETVNIGTDTTALYGAMASKANVGTTATSTQASWTNSAWNRYAFILTFTAAEAGPQTVTLSGIASAEAFGTTKINLKVSPSSIATREAWGSTVVKYDQTVTLSSIATGEAWGTQRVAFGIRVIMDVQGELNRIAGTDGLAEAAAANEYAGTVGLDVVGALNEANGSEDLDLQGVANALAGTTGLGVPEALSRI